MRRLIPLTCVSIQYEAGTSSLLEIIKNYLTTCSVILYVQILSSFISVMHTFTFFVTLFLSHTCASFSNLTFHTLFPLSVLLLLPGKHLHPRDRRGCARVPPLLLR